MPDRRRPGVAIAAAALIAATAACGGSPPEETAPQPAIARQGTPQAAASATPKTVKVGKPARIEIPAINVDAKVIPVGLQADGAMETPPSRERPGDPLLAGWYKDSRRPGQDGPSVIVGHVDGRQGADVFADLDQLKVGQKIAVVDKAKNVVEFVVKRTEWTPKTDVDWRRILNTKGATLWLFTCGGTFDRSTGHYLQNLIIESVRT